MDDQTDEKEVLECGGWSQEYDIGEDEEERLLLDEDEIAEPANQQVTEFEEQLYEGEESLDAEEDILDLDANEDVVEFEDSLGNGPEEMSKQSANLSIEENPSTSTQSSVQVIKQSYAAHERNDAGHKRPMPYSRNPHVRRNNMQNRQSNHSIPVQMAYVSGRPRPGCFVKQMRPLEPLMSTPIVRRPLMGDPLYPPPPLSGPRHPMNRIELHLPNFHPRMLQNTLRLPFKDHNPFPFNHMMQNEGNQGANRFFVNHQYPPRCSRDIRNLSAGPASQFAEIRPPFSSSDIIPKLFHGPPPPRPRDIVSANPLLTHPRFPTNLPPPPLPVHAAGLAQGPNLRMKLQSPQSLMDIVLPAPFGDPALQQSMFCDRQPRFRFHSPENRNHRPEFAQPQPTSGFPPGGSKRPPAKESALPVIPVKQFRNEPQGSLPMQRTFANNLTEAPSIVVNRVLDSATRNLARSNQPPFPTLRKKSLLETPPKPNAALLPTPNSTAPVPVSVATSSVSPDATNVSTTIWKVDTQDDGASQEMDEYLKKMEEQRKKREEVLRIKEERRRLKLAGKTEDGTADVKATQNASTTLPGMRATEHGGQSRYVTEAQHIPTKVNDATYDSSIPVKRAGGNLVSGNSAVTSSGMNEEFAVLPNESKRSIKVVAQSGQKMPQQTPAHNPRYKVIIVKNKMGQILEKRRVPLGEGVNTDTLVKREISLVASAWSSGRMSETVEIENLNSNATEEDVRRLCQMFGPVQEVYSKLQEGKAIVRFTSVKGANNFLCNHNTPGILVRYL